MRRYVIAVAGVATPLDGRGESQHQKIYRVPLARVNRAQQPENSAFRLTPLVSSQILENGVSA